MLVESEIHMHVMMIVMFEGGDDNVVLGLHPVSPDHAGLLRVCTCH